MTAKVIPLHRRGDEKDEEIRQLAIANGCEPFWYDGLIGWAWHCGCADRLHAHDQQCSVISLVSAARRR